MTLTFFESVYFTKIRSDYLSDIAYDELQLALLATPEMGDVLQETGGFRKLRWKDPGRGKGKRGGLRIIYYYLQHDCQLWFFTIFTKGEVSDLTHDEKKRLKLAIQDELNARKRSLWVKNEN